MQVCRTCLVRDVELHDIDICGLKESFEALTNCLLSQDGFPERLCWECRARLLACARFREKALRSQTLLAAATLFQQCNLQQVECVDRDAHGLTSCLTSETRVDHYDAAAVCGVKREPHLSYHHAQLNAPMETSDESSNDNKPTIHVIDQMNNVKVEAVGSEDSTKDTGNSTLERIHHDADFNYFEYDESEDKKFDIEQLSIHTNLKENLNNADDFTSTSVRSTHICNECDAVIEGTGNFVEHQETHKEKPYKCHKCNYKAALKIHLQRHVMAVHLGDRSYKCSRCNYTCCKKDRLQQHLMTHSGERPFRCICGYECIEKKRLRRHIDLDRCLTDVNRDELHLKQPQNTVTRRVQNSAQHVKPNSGIAFECDECGKGYRLKSELRKHIITHLLLEESMKASGYTFPCTVCQSTFTSKLLLSKHTKSHQPKYACTQCGYKTITKFRLALHQKRHTGEKPYKCDHCDYNAARKAHLRSHILCKHRNEKPFKCSSCYSRFNLKSLLRAHESMHARETQYKCSYCSFTSKHYSNIYSHQKLHSGDKPHKCGLCDYRAARKHNIKIHVMNVHTRERPIKCNLCSYACRTNWQLKDHMPVHSTEKAFKCESCSFKCKRSGELKKHARKHHNFQSRLELETRL